jgi:hypothetical protein
MFASQSGHLAVGRLLCQAGSTGVTPARKQNATSAPWASSAAGRARAATRAPWARSAAGWARVHAEIARRAESLTTGIGCTACAPGTLANEVGASTAAVCDVFAMGKFNSGPGARTCYDCPAGSCSVSAGTTAELGGTAGAPGRFSTRAASCHACPMGKFSGRLGASHAKAARQANSQSRQARPQSSDARPAPPGRFSTQARADTAAVSSAFAMGMFSGGLGSSSCEDCPSGTPWAGSAAVGLEVMRILLIIRPLCEAGAHTDKARSEGAAAFKLASQHGRLRSCVCL